MLVQDSLCYLEDYFDTLLAAKLLNDSTVFLSMSTRILWSKNQFKLDTTISIPVLKPIVSSRLGGTNKKP